MNVWTWASYWPFWTSRLWNNNYNTYFTGEVCVIIKWGYSQKHFKSIWHTVRAWQVSIISKGFSWVDLCPLKIHLLKPQAPASQNMNVFGHKDSADVIKFLWGH